MSHHKLNIFYFAISGFICYILFARDLIFFTCFVVFLELVYFMFTFKNYNLMQRVSYNMILFITYGLALAMFS